MSGRYSALLDEWREASGATRAAQARLSQVHELYVAGKGPAPSQQEIDELAALRRVETAKLQQALDYARSTACGPATGFGPLL